MLYHIITFIGIGAVAGILSGLLGIGGGIIVVPLLAFAFKSFHFSLNAIMHLAIGTSLAAMIVTTAASTLSHRYQGALIWPIYHTLAPGIIVGVLMGTLLAHYLPASILSFIFGLFVMFMAFYLSLNHQTQPQHTLPKPLSRFSIALLIGTKSGLLGIGGGVATVPFLTYYNVNMHDAVGISAACGLTIAIIGSITFALTGNIYWPAALCIALISPWFAILGTKLSYRLPILFLRRIFSIFLVIAGLRMIYAAFYKF